MKVTKKEYFQLTKRSLDMYSKEDKKLFDKAKLFSVIIRATMCTTLLIYFLDKLYNHFSIINLIYLIIFIIVYAVIDEIYWKYAIDKLNKEVFSKY